MKICVVGAGAMGCLFGGYLAKSGHEVWLIARSQDHIDTLSERGLRIRYSSHSQRIAVKASCDPKDAGVCDVVIVMTKFPDTASALESAKSIIGPDTIMVTLQNGIGNVEIIGSYADPERVLFGVTTLGAIRLEPGEIEVTAGTHAKTYLWSEAGVETSALKEFLSALTESGFDAIAAPNAKEQVWRKLCINSCISVLTAIVGLKVGPLVELPSACSLIRNLVLEITAVATKEGVPLDPHQVYEELISESRGAADHTPSILIDVVSNRKTEIECLNGAIVEASAKHGISTPYHNAIASLIEAIEQSYDDRFSLPHSG